MAYLIIATWDENNKPVKIQTKKTQKEVDEWFADNSDKYPDAIVGSRPNSNETGYITVDPVAKTFTFDEAQKTSDDELQDWQNQMAATDADMPRFMEDHIRDDHSGVTGNPYMQEKFDAKDALRKQKPV